VYDYHKPELMANNNKSLQRTTSAFATLRNFIQWPSFIHPTRQQPTPSNLSTYISPLYVERTRQDVASWREAIKEAESAWWPFRVKMQQMYTDTILNGHVAACIERRKNLTMLREWCLVDKQGNEVEGIKEMFEDQWFESFVSHTLDARFFGYSLIRIGDIVMGEITDCDIVRRTHISPDRRIVSTIPYSTGGVPFDDPQIQPWHVWVPTVSDIGVSPCGYGLLYKVAAYEIFMRNLIGFNADYIETFGMPTRVAKTNKSQRDPERMELENMLELMGSRGWAVLDPQDEVELIESVSARGQNNPYENLENRCIKFSSKVLLGHADALDSVPGKLGSSQGEDNPVNQALSQIKSVDGKFVENVVNKQLLPRLRDFGFKIPDGVKFRYHNNEEKQEAREREDKANLILSQVVSTLSTAGYDVDENYITDRTGIPVTKKAPVAPAPVDFTPQIKNKLNDLYGGKSAHRH
jgi:phage gp29-like protein